MKNKLLLVTGVFLLCFAAFSADNVQWPADFDDKLSAHISELKPRVAESACGVLSEFDAAMSAEGIGVMTGYLRNYAAPGFLLFLR